VLLLLAGCGEDAGQRTAREELQAYVATLPDAARYELAEAHCTDTARTFLSAVKTDVFICAVQRDEGGCDWFRVDFRRARADVRRTDRDAGCILPE
jgi:hypothetical protein